MNLELTEAERLMLVSALEFYRLKKGAEGKLACHALLLKDRPAAESLEQKYVRLQGMISSVNSRLKKGEAPA